ncbi:MAG: hypothetical protein GXY36_18910 [Chloroflexi bacterium]|nr:hypothetical protein [Chloroflexota bacterium]
MSFHPVAPTILTTEWTTLKEQSVMSVFFSSEPAPRDARLNELWGLLAAEQFDDAMTLAEDVCQDRNAPIEFFCGLSLAYGESGYYAEAEQVARTAVSFGEAHWRARHALAVAQMHQGRFLAALDTLGFYRTPPEIYVVRAQVEHMGGYTDSLAITLEDALQQDVPPAMHLYLAYLYGAAARTIPGWPAPAGAFREVARYRAHLDVWERDAARHRDTPYGQQLSQHIAHIRQISGQ